MNRVVEQLIKPLGSIIDVTLYFQRPAATKPISSRSISILTLNFEEAQLHILIPPIACSMLKQTEDSTLISSFQY
ncbi:MAG: hypothetical protein AB8G05_17585, partial [Oligoflexales bacterium]